MFHDFVPGVTLLKLAGYIILSSEKDLTKLGEIILFYKKRVFWYF